MSADFGTAEHVGYLLNEPLALHVRSTAIGDIIPASAKTWQAALDGSHYFAAGLITNATA